MNTATAVTRSSSTVWLVGCPQQGFRGSKLPTARDVMLNFHYYESNGTLSTNEIALKIYPELITIWEKCRIPTRSKQHVMKKLRI